MARTALLGRLGWLVGEVVELTGETPRTKSITLAVPNWAGHRPGQHVDIRLTAEDGYQAARSYSIASAPAPGRLTITVERLADGEVSPYLVDELLPGDPLELRGPIGGYFVWEPKQGGPLSLVAGGSGIVPLMSMLRHRAAVGNGIPTRLLYSSRSPADAIYRAELDELAAADDSLEIFHTFTRVQPVGWSGYRRRIDAEMLRDAGWPPASNPLAYICGPTSLVESAAAGLVATGHAPERIRTERFGPTGA
jgi:ferredoxin-NADP reductase